MNSSLPEGCRRDVTPADNQIHGVSTTTNYCYAAGITDGKDPRMIECCREQVVNILQNCYAECSLPQYYLDLAAMGASKTNISYTFKTCVFTAGAKYNLTASESTCNLPKLVTSAAAGTSRPFGYDTGVSLVALYLVLWNLVF